MFVLFSNRLFFKLVSDSSIVECRKALVEIPSPKDHLANLELVMRQQGCYETQKGLMSSSINFILMKKNFKFSMYM
jgi:hypothetical protein